METLSSIISDQHIQKIQASWQYLLKTSPDLIVRFYHQLFEYYPRLRPLFKDDIRHQSQKFLAYITFVVENLNDWPSLESELIKLGSRHKIYKVQREDYLTGGQIFLQTIKQELIEYPDEKIGDSWDAMYYALVKVMLEGHTE